MKVEKKLSDIKDSGPNRSGETKKNKNSWIIIGAVTILIVIAAFVAVFFLLGQTDETNSGIQTKQEEKLEQPNDAQTENNSEQTQKEESQTPAPQQPQQPVQPEQPKRKGTLKWTNDLIKAVSSNLDFTTDLGFFPPNVLDLPENQNFEQSLFTYIQAPTDGNPKQFFNFGFGDEGTTNFQDDGQNLQSIPGYKSYTIDQMTKPIYRVDVYRLGANTLAGFQAYGWDGAPMARIGWPDSSAVSKVSTVIFDQGQYFVGINAKYGSRDDDNDAQPYIWWLQFGIWEQ